MDPRPPHNARLDDLLLAASMAEEARWHDARTPPSPAGGAVPNPDSRQETDASGSPPPSGRASSGGGVVAAEADAPESPRGIEPPAVH
jgi:hypothetical protein